jgi:cyanophycin synthetase
LSDDDDVSIGMGDGSMTWPVASLPSPDDLPWPDFHDIPLGLVTGTNGKTSTTRIAASIVRAAGRSVGLSSTDGIRVDGELIESGDYSGPGGARTVLRDRRVSAAILETARGGILRRGLGVPCADAAVITTIAEDHAGDFGSRTTEELLEIKWVVSRALREGAPLILSADEALLVERAPRASAPIIWFSLNPQNPVVCQHIAAGGQAALLREGELLLIGDGQTHVLCKASEVPLALGGAARHQLANALAAAAMTWSLGIPIDAIARGLRTTTDNPGRGNLFDIDGRQVLVDFAHNPQAMQAIFDVASSLPARRRLLSFGQAGDRPDEAILKLAASAWSIGLDRAHVVDLPKYRRGRQTGEVSGLLERGMLEAGASATAISHYSSELASLEAALAWAEPGDLILMMALANSPDVLARLTALSRS